MAWSGQNVTQAAGHEVRRVRVHSWDVCLTDMQRLTKALSLTAMTMKRTIKYKIAVSMK